MIVESIKVLFFGMIGIFIVMGVIICTIMLLNRIGAEDEE